MPSSIHTHETEYYSDSDGNDNSPIGRYEDAQIGHQSHKKRRKDFSSDEENSQRERPRQRSKTNRKPGHPPEKYLQVLKESAQRHKENSRLQESQEMAPSRRKPPSKAASKADKEIAKELAELRKKLAEQERKNEHLESRVATASQPKKKIKVPSMVNIPANHGDSVKEAFAEHCWPQTKFIGNRLELKGVCTRIMEVLPQFKDLVSPDYADSDIAIDQFVDIYGTALTSDLNTRRTNVAGNMRKAYVKRAISGKKMPSTKELLSVIYRKDLVLKEIPEGASEDLRAAMTQENKKIRANLDIFRWYWEHLLPCVSGKAYWGPNIRKHVTISKGFFPDDPKKKYVTSCDEALVLITYENNYQRFPFVTECARAGKTFKTHKKEIIEDKRYNSRWTNAKAGQCKWGGWSEQGRIRFGQHRQNIALARQRDSTHTAEKWVLARIRGVPEEGVAPSDEEVFVLPMDFCEEAQVSFLDQDSDAEMEEIAMEDLDDLPVEVIADKKKKKTPPKAKENSKDDDDEDEENDDDDDDDE